MEITNPIQDNSEGPGPGKPEPPPGYAPLSVQNRTDWNTFLDYLKSQGNINLNDPQVGINFLNQYKQNNPSFSITPQQLPFIQYEQSQLRKGDAFGNLNADQLKTIRTGLRPEYLNANVPDFNTFTPDTAKLYYPQFKSGNRDFGTNMEDYLSAKGGVPVTQPASTSAVSPTTTTPLQWDRAAMKQKYASNPYLMDQNRYNWGEKLNNEFPQAGGNVREGVVNAAKFNGIDPALLYGSAMEEGMSGAVDPKYADNASEAYVNWSEKNKDKAGDYPVDGFYNYGLDQFADNAASLEKKGYLPKGFSDKYTKFYAENEKGEKINASAFKTDADALMAKSAMMRQSKDELDDYIKNSGVKLTPNQKEFFLLANYNGGIGLMKKMIQSYKDKGYLKDEKFLDVKFVPESYRGVYRNVMARLQSAHQLRDEKML